eukprot:2843505-Rhodomonas_salina.1
MLYAATLYPVLTYGMELAGGVRGRRFTSLCPYAESADDASTGICAVLSGSRVLPAGTDAGYGATQTQGSPLPKSPLAAITGGTAAGNGGGAGLKEKKEGLQEGNNVETGESFCPTRCAVLGERMVLRARYAKPGTELACGGGPACDNASESSKSTIQVGSYAISYAAHPYTVLPSRTPLRGV